MLGILVGYYFWQPYFQPFFILVWLPKDNDSKYHIWDNGSKLELPIKRTKWILTYDQAFEMPFNSISYICWLFMTLLYQNNQPISKYLLQNGTWYWVEVQAKPRFEHHPDPVVYVNIHDSTVLACTVCIFDSDFWTVIII